MKSAPTLSIVIPVFNTGKLVVDLLNIILKDKFQDFEIIIIDDGSTDDSYQMLKKISNSKIKLYHTKNRGVSAARNLGIEKSLGRFIMFLDSDDKITPNYISTMVKEISKPNISLVSAAIKYHRLNTGITTDLYSSPALTPNFKDTHKQYILKLLNRDGRLYSVSSKIFHRQVIAKNHLKFDTKLNFAEDTKFVLEYLDLNREELVFLNNIFYIYNFGTETSIVSNSSLIWSNWLKSYQFLRSWASPLTFPKDNFLLFKIYLRWRISHSLAVARSNKTFRQKLQHLGIVRLFLASLIVKFRH